jgi:phospholipid/cholesterol/gamma-HCH transport system substrate-binding protein
VEANPQQNLKVGVFVFGLTLLLLGSVFVLGGSGELMEDRYKLYGRYSDVAGLKEGAVVRLAGWDVGEVSANRFAENLEQKELTVEMSILARYQARIRADSEARIDTVGVLGDKYVSISMGSPDKDGLDDGAEIATRAPLDFLNYTRQFDDIMQNTTSISRKFDLMLGDDEEVAEAKVASSLRHMESLLGAARDGDGLMHALVYDREMPKRVSSILRNLDRASDGLANVTNEIKEGDGLANEMIYGSDGAALATQLGDLADALATLTRDLKSEESMLHSIIYDPDKAQVIDDLAETMASLRRTSKALENGDGTLGLLAHDPALYEDLRALVGGAQRNKLLRNYIRRTIQEGEAVNASAWATETKE